MSQGNVYLKNLGKIKTTRKFFLYLLPRNFVLNQYLGYTFDRRPLWHYGNVNLGGRILLEREQAVVKIIFIK